MIKVLDHKGQASYTKQAVSGSNDVEMAKSYLTNYQTSTANLLFGQLKTTLDNVEANKNSTQTFSDKILKATSGDNETAFKWYYSINGISAEYSKFIMLSFTNGSLDTFVDNWQFYNVNNASVNVSEKGAESIALQTAKEYFASQKAALGMSDIDNFNESNIRWSSLLFDNSLDANNTRGSDVLELFPVWRVGIALDKWYGQLYGVEVDIWADTGEVRSVQEAWSTLPSPDGISVADGNKTDLTAQVSNYTMVTSAQPLVGGGEAPVIVLILSILIIVAFVPFIFRWLVKKDYLVVPSPRFFKSTQMLCTLILCVMFFASVSTVAAMSQGIVWGSESTGGYGYDYPYPGPYNVTWRKSQPEISFQRQIAANISQWFSNNGYYGVNHQGSDSTRTQILADLSNSAYYDCLAVVDFDHGVGGLPGQDPTLGPDYNKCPPTEFHYMIEDNRGTYVGPEPSPTTEPQNAVYDMDIYSSGKAETVFAFINTCLSADIANVVSPYGYNGLQRIEPAQGSYIERPVGMPLAWMGRSVAYKYSQDFDVLYNMSDDGYLRPDSGGQVYIGFQKGSASLEQKVPYDNGTYPYYYWVWSFFYFALNSDTTVNQALNSASNMIYGENFGSCPLQYFESHWFGMNQSEAWKYSKMAVYGDGDIKLYQPLVHFSAVCDDPGHEGLYTPFTLDGFVEVNSQDRLRSKTYTVSVNSLHNYQFDHFTFNGVNYGSSIPLTCDGNLVAHYTWAPVYYNLTVSSTGYGYTIPTGTNSCLSFTTQTATAYPDAGYIHYWIQDDINDPDFAPTKEVLMDDEHTLQAYFVERPEYNFPSYVTSSEGTAYDANRLAGVDNDGRYATLDGWGPYEMYGSITAQLYFAEGGHIYAYGYAWTNGPLYVYASEDGSNWELVSTPTVGDTLGWIDCGIYNGPCNYIKFTAESPNDVYNVYLDSVRVQPLYYHTLSISTDGEGYTSPSGNPVYERNSYAGVTACAAPTWVFDYWTLDGDYAGSDPTIYVYMDYDYNLEAHFSEASSLQYLTVNTYDAYLGYPYSPNVWVDGYWIGTGQQTLQVASGREHTVSVDYTVYSEYWGCDANFIDFTGDVYYYPGYGPAYIYPTSSTTINALYLPYWWT
jgi:hypothetical protein